jgi:hypothetical protein
VKIRITFKTPDAVDYAVTEQVQGLPEEEADVQRGRILFSLGKYIKWGEMVTICFDTDAGTATVEPANG